MRVKTAARPVGAAPLLEAQELDDAEIADLFGGVTPPGGEGGRQGAVLLYRSEPAVVLKAKELKALRPHGQILRTGYAFDHGRGCRSPPTHGWASVPLHGDPGHVSINRLPVYRPTPI